MEILTIEHLLGSDFVLYPDYSTPIIQKSNFQKAFYVLPKKKRIAISNFYLFCAYLDDIVDNESNKNIAKDRIASGKNIIHKMEQNETPSNLLPLWNVFNSYNVNYSLVLQLIEGIERDLYQNRYETFDEMLSYCYGVASVVGLICMQIFLKAEIVSEKMRNYAVNLGYALQITNIMRDIGEDYKRDYIYVPQELLAEFNYSEDDIKNKIYNQNFFDLMDCLYHNAIEYYELATQYYDGNPNLRTAQCMKNIYYKLLQKIKRKNYKIYEKKIRISNGKKLLILLTS